MKKITIFAAFVIAAMAFSSCESRPVEPNIIGSGIIREGFDGYYVLVDSISWPISAITAHKDSPRECSPIQKIVPIEGVKVTVFTSEEYNGIQAVLGEQNEEQIEALYHASYTNLILTIVLLIFICCAGISVYIEYKYR